MRLRTDQHHMKMGGGSGKRDHGHPPGRQTHGNRGKIAYGTGNMDSWRDDDMRVALIVLLIATAWIAILIRKRQGKDTWLDRIVGNIGFGLGNSSAPGFSRQALSAMCVCCVSVCVFCGFVFRSRHVVRTLGSIVWSLLLSSEL